jgi:hypothetical protein
VTASLVDPDVREGPAPWCGALARPSRLHPFTILAIVTMVVLVGLTIRTALGDGPATSQPVRLSSSGAAFTTLDELIDASDVVVIGRAVSVAPGRLFAAGDSAGFVSQISMIEVGAVLAGPDPGATIALEEEATMPDGRSVIVDGLRPTHVGDQGIFFLIRGDPELRYFASAGTVGRLLRSSLRAGDDGLLVVDDNELAAELAAMGGRALSKAVEDRTSSATRMVP